MPFPQYVPLPLCYMHHLYDTCRWLGQNSKQNKLNWQLVDVQVLMCPKVSGDKHEIRQLYIPALFPHVVKPLIDQGMVGLGHLRFLLTAYHILYRPLSRKSLSGWTSIICLARISILSLSSAWTTTK